MGWLPHGNRKALALPDGVEGASQRPTDGEGRSRKAGEDYVRKLQIHY